MGELKQLLVYDGAPLVARAASAALGSRCDPVYVVVGAGGEQVGAALAGLDVECVANSSWADGLASSIRAGVAAAIAEGASPAGVLLLLADQPYLTSEALDALVERFDGEPSSIVASGYRGRVGVPALFGAEHYQGLGELEGDRGARTLLDQHRPALQVVDLGDAARDIDTQEDYRALTANPRRD
jgi:molybdenum cofactor cytidylyltransferase